jgi:hypothetical protein
LRELELAGWGFFCWRCERAEDVRRIVERSDSPQRRDSLWEIFLTRKGESCERRVPE